MQIEMLRAGRGDCLLLHGETAQGPALVLIDGGPAGIYEKHLRKRLVALRGERGLDEFTPLLIDLVIVSHVDDDHVNGIIDLFEEMADAQERGEPPLFRVGALWHNSFDDILGNDEVKAAAAQFGAASFAPMAAEAADQTEWDAAMLLASIDQGQKLRDLANKLGIAPNADFGGGLVQVRADARLIREVGGIRFTVVAPRAEELAALQEKHDKWLKKKRERGQPVIAQDFLQALTDTSVANLSSIVLLAEHGDRSILLTGDARSDHILSGLDRAGLAEANDVLTVEVLKMPHHGSDRNLDETFLARVKARSYLFSGDGKHGNPERATIAMLFATPPAADYDLYLTYPPDEIDHERERDHKGSPWSAAIHGVGALLDGRPAGASVRTAAGHGIIVPPPGG